jgi:hypothetical protein
MKIVLEYDESTGLITSGNGMTTTLFGMIGVEEYRSAAPVLELVKQGLSTDDIVKLRNNDLI